VNVYPEGKLDFFVLNTFNIYFIKLALIPLLDDLTWRSKKYLDYCDWKYIIAILQKGFHYLPEGKALIDKILGQMNNNRLSTSLSKELIVF